MLYNAIGYVLLLIYKTFMLFITSCEIDVAYQLKNIFMTVNYHFVVLLVLNVELVTYNCVIVVVVEIDLTFFFIYSNKYLTNYCLQYYFITLFIIKLKLKYKINSKIFNTKHS